MGSKLVIVESPAKAKTISKYLGPGYEVLASVGHIRDLVEPKDVPAEKKKTSVGKFGIDIENDFEPMYAISAGKSKTVSDLKKALAGADELLLATDEDREGEAIAWHLLQVLKPKVPVKRMVFHEITKDAIQHAVNNTRELDTNLVEAQETRRVVDRLYGYELSPVLWRKINRGLSAGRVQSPATRLVVERERERMAFVSASYHDVKATFQTGDSTQAPFEAKLVTLAGKKIATGDSFDDSGRLKTDVLVLDQASAEAVAAAVLDSSAVIKVQDVESKPSVRRPAAPFTTSTLQQEASRKLRMSAKQTMDTAQQLYQDGHITYMRTDSPTLSDQAITAARNQAKAMFGAEFVADAPRKYAGKNKNAQEAHEAIRPAGEVFRTPADLRSVLSGRALDLYDLIWKRTVASQMQDARVSTTTAKISVSPLNGTQFASAEFTASGTVVTFRGFMAAYEESFDEGRNDDDERSEKKLPNLEVGHSLTPVEVFAKDHQTLPPPRYTEASLVKALEEDGIGRPSTYASILSNIVSKGYIHRRGQALVPEWIAFTVIRFLEENFGQLVDYAFTAQMEEDLDKIASGQLDRLSWLKRFYFGESQDKGLLPTVESMVDQDARAINSFAMGDGVTLRTGKYGPYLEVAGTPGVDGADENGRRVVNLPEDLAPDELNPAKITELVNAPVATDRVLGLDPETGAEILFKDGRYGPYVTIADGSDKPKTASLFKSMNPATITLDQALKLLSLPRVVGVDPATGEEITAQNGKFGPFLRKGTDSRSLAAEEEIFSYTIEQALELYAQPKYRGRAAAAAPLKEFGEDPASGGKVVAKTGQFGSYITDGFVNATIPKDETIEELSNDRAYELLAIRREKLGLEPGQAPAKVSKAGARKAAPAKTVKRGATRKAK
ncbi:MAG: type I DNA topoisomerase [Micrococcales bacterium]